MIEQNKVYFIKTVTNYFVGQVADFSERPDGQPLAIKLWPASWISEQGIRQSEFLARGAVSQTESERYSAPVWVPFHCITEWTEWPEGAAIPESTRG